MRNKSGAEKENNIVVFCAEKDAATKVFVFQQPTKDLNDNKDHFGVFKTNY